MMQFNLLKQLIPLIVIMLLLFSGTFLTGCTPDQVTYQVTYPVPHQDIVNCGTQVGIYNNCRG